MPAGTIIFTETNDGTVRTIVAAWTSGPSGEAAVGTTTEYYVGKLESLETNPTDTPTDNYDVTVADASLVDVLAGAGLDRDDTLTETVAAASLGFIGSYSRLSFTISNAGNSKNGVITIEVSSQLAAYATDTQYRARTGDQTTGTNIVLNAQLLAVSRLIERALEVMPGAFNAHNGTYVFDGNGKNILPLRDRGGLAYPFTAITADSLLIDSDMDGTYDDYTLDTSDPGIRGLPANAAAFGEPYWAIELRAVSGALLSTFPNLPGCLQITGTFGWSAVPDIITELVCHRTAELRESLKDGGTGRLPAFESPGVPMRPHTAWLWKEAEGLYTRRIPIFQ